MAPLASLEPDVRDTGRFTNGAFAHLDAHRCSDIHSRGGDIGSNYQIVIPARLDSTRLPGKPLLDVAGKPLIRRVWDVARAASAEGIVVATPDPEIIDIVTSFGGRAVSTSKRHESGTDRLAEVAEREQWDDDTIVVNLQGDEPCIEPALLDHLAELLRTTPAAGIATLATPLRSVEEWFDPSVVKVVLRGDRGALYFSRAPIPWVRDHFSPPSEDRLPKTIGGLRHLGLYAYRAKTLRAFARLPVSPLERAERLEQLRALEAGIQFVVGTVEEPPGHGVDTPDDLARVRDHFRSFALPPDGVE